MTHALMRAARPRAMPVADARLRTPSSRHFASSPASHCACGGTCPRCALRAAGPDAPAQAPAQAPAPQAPPSAPAPAAAPEPAVPAPTIGPGAITITSKPTSVTADIAALIQTSSRWKVENNFTVSASAPVQEPAGHDGAFQYGIVQNVMYDHIYETFTPAGDILVDSVGPLVDVGSKDEVPFIHANQAYPTGIFRNDTATPSFTDIPSLDVAWNLHCGKSKWVKPRKVERTLALTAALVAQHVRSKQLFQLGGIGKMYRVKWVVEIADDDSFKSTDLDKPDGTYPLSASAAAVTLDGTIANDQAQALLKAENDAFQDRCEDVLPAADASAAPEAEPAEQQENAVT